MFAPSRDQSRRFLIDAWAKRRAGTPLSGLEQMAAAVIALHPEYHAIVEAPERHIARDYPAEAGEVNPFLHMSLHLAIAEQLAIDQPPGIRAEFERLRASRRPGMTREPYTVFSGQWQRSLIRHTSQRGLRARHV